MPNGRYLVGGTVAVSRLNRCRGKGIHTTAGLEGSGSANGREIDEFKLNFNKLKPSFVQSVTRFIWSGVF